MGMEIEAPASVNPEYLEIARLLCRDLGLGNLLPIPIEPQREGRGGMLGAEGSAALLKVE